MNAQTKLKTVEDEIHSRDEEALAAANMRVWNAVCRTDPKHTKPVEFGRKFTAIDAHYQIQEATRQFGPIGEGWGYQTGQLIFEDGLVIAPVTLWHGSRDKTFGPLYGSTTLRDTKGKIDKDAPKKATTDALTKGLSQLGFNADVFLGKFDDNKYVAEARKEFEEQKAGGNPSTGEPKPNGRVKYEGGPYTCPTQLMTAARQFVHTLNGLGDYAEYLAWAKTEDVRAFVKQLKKEMPDWWDGGPDVPGDFVPLAILTEQKERDLQALDEIKTREAAE